ncbi:MULTISPECIES: hypothetical protein [Flavobacterium]|uniref:Uncharacterized protein n=1 Tax=Flavobacterium keumense TaxID=1306518 RepID=A0ABY8N515_9FLAO|nr:MULTISPECIES: hypothetical protein [Flavobacterium]WGK94742.1 hypothetical protein MG292_00515 [Flavobacterium keumense]
MYFYHSFTKTCIVFIAKEVQSPPIYSGQTYEVDEMRTFLWHKGKVIWKYMI